MDDRLGSMGQNLDGMGGRLSHLEEVVVETRVQLGRLEESTRLGFQHNARQFEELRRHIIRDELREPLRPRQSTKD